MRIPISRGTNSPLTIRLALIDFCFRVMSGTSISGFTVNLALRMIEALFLTLKACCVLVEKIRPSKPVRNIDPSMGFWVSFLTSIVSSCSSPVITLCFPSLQVIFRCLPSKVCSMPDMPLPYRSTQTVRWSFPFENSYGKTSISPNLCLSGVSCRFRVCDEYQSCFLKNSRAKGRRNIPGM